MPATAEQKELMFTRDYAVSCFNRAKAIYMSDLQVASNPLKEQATKETLRKHFNTMVAAADGADEATKALEDYNAAHAPPAVAEAPKLEAVPAPATA